MTVKEDSIAPSRRALCRALEELAPLSLAEPWDNVGLLLESAPDREAPCAGVLLTIDLTDAVLEEALSLGVGLIVAYHPPIFKGLKRLGRADPGQRRLLRALHAGIDIYSPHTALDAVSGGVCDWLAEALGPARSSAPIKANQLRPEEGSGRVVQLRRPLRLETLLRRIHGALEVPYLRVAAPQDISRGERLIEEVALCPGAGGGLFEGLRGPQLFLSGELRHHDVLSFVAHGAAVVLTEHSRCERGYLPHLAASLRERWPGLQVSCSEQDDDPLQLSLPPQRGAPRVSR